MSVVAIKAGPERPGGTMAKKTAKKAAKKTAKKAAKKTAKKK